MVFLSSRKYSEFEKKTLPERVAGVGRNACDEREICLPDIQFRKYGFKKN